MAENGAIIVKKGNRKGVDFQFEEKQLKEEYPHCELIYADFGTDLVNPITPSVDRIDDDEKKELIKLKHEELERKLEVSDCDDLFFDYYKQFELDWADSGNDAQEINQYIEKCDKESGLYYCPDYCDKCLDIVCEFDFE